MKTPEHHPSSEGLLDFARGWDRFFFRPEDTTTLGLIRICCGLITLYVHLVYAFELQALVGKNAWFDLETANEFRTEAPVFLVKPSWDFDVDRTYDKGNFVWSVWYHVTDPRWMVVVHAVFV